MIKKYLTVRYAIAALCIVLLALCLAWGGLLISRRAAFADNTPQPEDGVSAASESNDWVTNPSMVSWKWGDFDEKINVITAQALYGNENMYFRIYFSHDEDSDDHTSMDKIEWLTFSRSIDIGGIDSFNAFRLEDGEIPEYVQDTLRALDAETYHLVAYIPAAEDGSYTALSSTTPFSVLGVYNTITKLTIEQWTWREYDNAKNTIGVDVAHGWSYDLNGNVVYDTDKYETIKNITYSVYYETGAVLVSETLSGFRVDSYGKVSDLKVSQALENLDAGNYILVANTNDGCANYSDAEMQISFKVLKHSNYWTTTPSILQWTWHEYDRATCLINGAAKYSGSAVHFGIFKKSTCESSDAIIEKFELGADGLVTKEVADVLADLDAGTYHLKGWTDDNSKNYANCEGVVPFTVQKAQNGWTVSPYVVSWQYGEYDKTFNLIKGEARYDAVTAFSVYTDEACTQAVEFSEAYNGSKTLFVLGEDGLVPDYVTEKLFTLSKGMYYLLATVEGTDNYYGINDGSEKDPVPFEIRSLTNYWIEAPGLLSWSEGHFDAFAITDNLTGIAKAGDVKFTISDEQDRVLFVISTHDGKITSVKKGNGDESKISDLNSIPVGAYKLLAEVEGGENYTSLSCPATFAVYEDSIGLTGIIAAAITFAIIDVAAAGFCIALIIIRRKKVEEQFRKMIKKELNRR